MNKLTVTKPEERREFVRLKSVFPVDYSIVHLQGDLPGLDWHRGFTSNVSKGGLCLETDKLTESTIIYIAKHNVLLDLRIFIPLNSPPIKAVGELQWYQRVGTRDKEKFILGLKFHSITEECIKRVLGRAYFIQMAMKIFPIIAIVLIGGLALCWFLI